MYALIYVKLACSVCQQPLESYHNVIGESCLEVKPCEHCMKKKSQEYDKEKTDD